MRRAGNRLADYGVQAWQDCVRAALDSTGGRTADVSVVVGRIDRMVRDLGDPSAGYWQVRARDAETSSIVVEILVGDDQPGREGRSSSQSLSLEADSAAGSVSSAVGSRRNDEETRLGSQATGLWQRESLPSERQCIEVDQKTTADVGRVVVIRCHAIPQPERAADGDLMSLLSLCQWLRGQDHTESGSVPASPSSPEFRTGPPTVELVIAYDPGNGNGAWLHYEVAANAEPAPGLGRSELNPATDPPGSAEYGPPLGGSGRRSVDDESGLAALGPSPKSRELEPSAGAGTPTPGMPGRAASSREHTTGRGPGHE